MKKLLSITLIGIFFSAGIFLIQPKQVDAFLGFGDITWDPGNFVPNLLTSGETVWGTISKEVLEPLVKQIADRVLDKLVRDTLNWANGGFDGDPGFINNWDEFLKGTQHAVISSTFQTANLAAQAAQQNANANSAQCILNAGVFEPSPCDDQYLNDFEGCIFGLDPVEDPELYEACENQRDAGEIAHNQCLDDWIVYDEIIQECGNSGIYGGAGAVAQQNYNIMQSGESASARIAVRTIADEGARQLVGDNIDDVFSGRADLTGQLLGSQSAKDSFSNGNFKVGGYGGYLSLLARGSTDFAVNETVKKYTIDSANEASEKAKDKTQITEPFLDRTECTEYAADGSCEREVTTTPNSTVGSQVSAGIQKDFQQAYNAEGLMGSLVKALGDVTGGLINVGLSELSGAATNAFFNTSDTTQFTSANGTLGGFQSDYDVLGIAGEQIGGNPGTNTTSGGGNYLGGDVFIGGPEDVVDGQYGSVQIIVDFQKELDVNIDLLEEEKFYYDDLRILLGSAADVLFEFDKCIPGPDYDWDRRYKDVLSTSSIDEDGQINTIGFNETRNMSRDPQVNIPGGITMLDQHEGIIRRTQDESVRNNIRVEKIRDSLSTLNFIKQQMLSTFNEQKASVNPNLVLFKEDWEALNDTQRADALSYAFDNGYYIGSDSVSTTISGTNNFDASAALTVYPDRTRNAVISAGFDVWRSQTDPEEKLDLRRAFYVTQNDFSNEEFIAIAETKYNQLNLSIEQSYSVAADCMVFKLYALGTNRPFIANIIFNSEPIEEKVMRLARALYAFEPGGDGDPTNDIGSGNNLNILSGFVPYNVSTARNDSVIKNFVESEYNLQNDGISSTTSVFSTLTVTSPASIASSILGFANEQEKQDYFSSYYPEDGNGSELPLSFPKFPNTNKHSIKTMYQVDRVFGSSNRVTTGMHGHLFCRNKGDQEIVNSAGGGDSIGTRCWQDFYSASRLDYQLLVSGINN